MTVVDPAQRLTLVRHPASQALGVASVAASLRRPIARRLQVRFRLLGDAAQVVWPSLAATSLRLDNLWRATCCEVFVRTQGASGYREWNLSPAGHWQCYEFSTPRTDRQTPEVALPAIDLHDAHVRERTEWRLTAEIDVPENPLVVGVSMVVADRHGRLDYWALDHGTGPPDFHNPATWIAQI